MEFRWRAEWFSPGFWEKPSGRGSIDRPTPSFDTQIFICVLLHSALGSIESILLTGPPTLFLILVYLFVLNYKSRWVLGVLTGPPLNTLISARCVEKLKSCEFFGRNLLRCQGWVFCALCCLPKLDLFPLKLNCLNIHSFWLGGVLSGLGVFMMGLLAANSSPPCFGLVFGSLGGVCL